MPTQLTFPFRNKLYHDLIGFYNVGSIDAYVQIQEGRYPYQENYFETEIEFYKSSLINFESELLQVINTSIQETIDIYFNELINYANDIYSTFNSENLREIVRTSNDKALIHYNEKIEKDTEEYFKREERNLSHLASYESIEYNGFLGIVSLTPKKVTRTNYNFYCVETSPDLIDEKYIESYYSLVTTLSKDFFDLVRKYIKQWKEGKIKSKQIPFNKPVLFVEGDLDIIYIKKAAEYFNQENLINAIEIRQRGGSANLNKLWNILRDANWETVPQRKMLLYDSDTNVANEDYGFIYKRTIPFQQNNPVKKGIENLFSISTIEKAVKHNPRCIDVAHTKGLTRGEAYEKISYEINKDEKRNFCEWVCENGNVNDFEKFEEVLFILTILLGDNA